jgi:hypothetical protein
MKNKIFAFLFIAIISLGFSILGSYIYNKYFVNNNEKISSLSILKDSLNLSENQFCQMKQCQTCYKDSINALNCEIHRYKYELILQLRNKDKDKDSINILINKIDSLQSKLLHNLVNNIISQKSILNESQKEKFFNILLSQLSVDGRSCNLINKTQSIK